MPTGQQPNRTYSRRSLHGQVANEIAQRIMSGEFAPGTILPNEADFSVKLKVSRTALREAIKVLAAKGLVESRPKIGTRIRPRDHWNMLDPDVLAWQFASDDVARFADDLFEVRQIIEPAAAALAAVIADRYGYRGDTATYDMICAAKTVGVFQIESRAQMSMPPTWAAIRSSGSID